MATPLREVLGEIELFATLGSDARHHIAEVGRMEHWKAGAVVLEEGAYSARMLVILDGEVEILRRDRIGVQRPVSQLSSGHILGEMSLLFDLPRTATVRACTDLSVFAIDRQAFRDLLAAQEPAFLRLGFELTRVLARRLMTLNDQVTTLLSDYPELQERFGTARQGVFELWDSEPHSQS